MYSGMFTPASFHDPTSLVSIFLALLFSLKESAGSVGTWDQTPEDWTHSGRWTTLALGHLGFFLGGQILGRQRSESHKKHVLQKEDFWVAISWRSQRSYSELVTYCDEAWIPKIVVRFRTGLQICSPQKTWLAKTSSQWLRSTVKSSKTIRLNLRICFKVFKL